MAANDNALPPPDGDGANAPVAVKEDKGTRRTLLIVTVLVLAALGSGAAVAFSQYSTIARAASVFVNAAPDSSETETPVPEFGTFHKIGNMIVNPAETEGRRYLMVDIAFESADPVVKTELQAKDVVLRDLLIRRLATRTVAELSDVDLRPQLKTELRDSVNVLLAGEVDRLYFTQFVLQ